MRVPECEVHLLAFHLGSITDADDVEILAKAFGHAARPRWRPGCAPGRGTCPAPNPLAACGPRVDRLSPRSRCPRGSGWRSLPFGPCTSTAPDTTSTLTPLGIAIGFFPIRDMSQFPVASFPGSRLQCQRPTRPALRSGSWELELDWLYHTLQNTSPPTPALTASRPVMTPRDVVRMLVPSPASTSGTRRGRNRRGDRGGSRAGSP